MFIKKDLRKIPTILAEAKVVCADGDDELAETISTSAIEGSKQKQLLVDLPLQRKYHGLVLSAQLMGSLSQVSASFGHERTVLVVEFSYFPTSFVTLQGAKPNSREASRFCASLATPQPCRNSNRSHSTIAKSQISRALDFVRIFCHSMWVAIPSKSSPRTILKS